MIVKFEHNKKKFACDINIKPRQYGYEVGIIYKYKLFGTYFIKNNHFGNYKEAIEKFDSYTEEQLTEYVKEIVIKDYELKIKAKKWS